MPLHKLDIRPRDLLFFRDARPMAASDVGRGADWPLPHILHEALINASHRAWPEHQAWEHDHRKNDRDNPHSSDRFGYLKTAGPWPCLDDRLFLPTPADLLPSGHLMAPLADSPGGSNLPKPLTHPVGSLQEPTKVDLSPWLNRHDYDGYLAGKAAPPAGPVALFDAERQVGIGIDADTHATEKGKFYSAEYLRLRQNVILRAWAEADYRHPNGTETDVLAELLSQEQSIIMGGQQGMADVVSGEGEPELPMSQVPAGSTRIKWVLLSPAVYSSGWLPPWVDAVSGKVMLKRGDTSRRAGEKRQAWRARLQNLPEIAARLVAACVPKPLTFSGWDLRLGGPKPTKLAVPAGTVYYLEAESPEAAQSLVAALAWHGSTEGRKNGIRNRPGTAYGEKGFGLGVCGTWDFLNINASKQEN